MAVQWLKLQTFNAGRGWGSIAGWGTKISYAVGWLDQKKKKNPHKPLRNEGSERVRNLLRLTASTWQGQDGNPDREAYKSTPCYPVCLEELMPGVRGIQFCPKHDGL